MRLNWMSLGSRDWGAAKRHQLVEEQAEALLGFGLANMKKQPSQQQTWNNNSINSNSGNQKQQQQQ